MSVLVLSELNELEYCGQIMYCIIPIVFLTWRRVGNNVGIKRQVFFAGHIPQVTITGHSIFARKQHKNNLNSANRTRLALKYIFSKNIFCLGAQF